MSNLGWGFCFMRGRPRRDVTDWNSSALSATQVDGDHRVPGIHSFQMPPALYFLSGLQPPKKHSIKLRIPRGKTGETGRCNAGAVVENASACWEWLTFILNNIFTRDQSTRIDRSLPVALAWIFCAKYRSVDGNSTGKMLRFELSELELER